MHLTSVEREFPHDTALSRENFNDVIARDYYELEDKSEPVVENGVSYRFQLFKRRAKIRASMGSGPMGYRRGYRREIYD